MPALRSSGHLLQLVQKSALPQVSDPSAPALAGGPRARTPGHQLLPCGLHCAARTQCAGLGQCALVLRPAVHRQRANLAGDRGRSQTLGGKNRRDQHSAHLGAKPVAASPHSLRYSCGRNIARSLSLDPPSVSFLPTREDPQPRLSWKISCWSETPLSQQETTLRRSSRCFGRLCAVHSTDPPPAPSRLGGLCQAGLRWSPAGVAI